MHISKKTFLALAILPFLAGCGTTTTDRAASGAGLGAAAGAVTSAAVGGNLATGALIGAGAGGLAGAATNSNQVNLGKPVWR